MQAKERAKKAVASAAASTMVHGLNSDLIKSFLLLKVSVCVCARAHVATMAAPVHGCQMHVAATLVACNL
jgi:hypothetical protein